MHIEIPYQWIEGLENKSDTIDSETGEVKYSVGYSDCIKIRKVRDGMRIECSLSKLLKGNNIYSLSFSEVTFVIKMIEEKLGIPIREGIIRRLDCEYTIRTKLKVKEYFRYFGDSRYFTRSTIQKTSIYYTNTLRVFNIYDKIKEMKNKRVEIPEDFKNTNVMRCEFRYRNQYLRNIAKEMGLEYLKVENLLDKEVYTKIAELAFKEYKSISKVKNSHFDFSILHSKAKFFEQLIYEGIEANGGLNVLLDKIDASRAYNTGTPKEYYSRRKNEAKKIMSIKKEIHTSNIIDEINTKITEKYLAIIN